MEQNISVPRSQLQPAEGWHNPPPFHSHRLFPLFLWRSSGSEIICIECTRVPHFVASCIIDWANPLLTAGVLRTEAPVTSTGISDFLSAAHPINSLPLQKVLFDGTPEMTNGRNPAVACLRILIGSAVLVCGNENFLFRENVWNLIGWFVVIRRRYIM